MNTTTDVISPEVFSYHEILPSSIRKKILEEQNVRKRRKEEALDMTRDDNRNTASRVCQGFNLQVSDDYGDFVDVVNQTIRTGNETARLFSILNGSPLGLHFLNKLNLDTLEKKAVRDAFISWAKNLISTVNGIESIDESICMAYTAILEDQQIDPKDEWGHAFELIKIADKNHSARVFATYKHIWDILQRTKTKKNGVLDNLKARTAPWANISDAQLGQLYTELLQRMKNSIYSLTDANIIEPMIRDKSSILAILESYADRTIGNMEYLRWTQNDHILNEILDYLLAYYSRLIQVISERDSLSGDDRDTFALKQLMEKFIILHREPDLRIKALNAIDKQGEFSMYIVERFLKRKLNKNIKSDSAVLIAERNVKRRALQIYESILRDSSTKREKRGDIENSMKGCLMDSDEDNEIRKYAVDIVCELLMSEETEMRVALEKIKRVLADVIEIEASASIITKHCPSCGHTVTDRTIQERTLQLYEIALKGIEVSSQLKESIEKNLEILILDPNESAESRKFALDIICRTRDNDETSFNKAKELLVQVIENQGRSKTALDVCPNCNQRITDKVHEYCTNCGHQLR